MGSGSCFRTHIRCTVHVVNFLADLHAAYQTSALNAYRFAISSDDMYVGKHPLVCRVLKGAFHATPPLLRYTATWDVQVVFDCILQWGDTTSLSLKLLTFKLVMLMFLARLSHLAGLCKELPIETRGCYLL